MALSTLDQQKLDRLIKLVSLRVDEYLETQAEADQVEIPFGDIGFELDQAARFVLRRVPRHLAFFASKNSNFVTLIPDTINDKATLPVPSDFLRFLSVTLDGWKQPSRGFIRDDSGIYQQQQFDHLRGTVEKPVTAMVPYPFSYAAGNAPGVLCEQTEGLEVPSVGETLDDGTTVAEVESTEDPDFIQVTITDGGYTPLVGGVLEKTGGGYKLTIRYLSGSPVTRISKAGQALEAWPLADGTLNSFVYVPVLASYKMPPDLEDELIWKATSAILMIMRLAGPARDALAQMQLAGDSVFTGMMGEEVPA